MCLLRFLWKWLRIVGWVYRGLFLTVAYIPILLWAVMYEMSRSKLRNEFYNREYGPEVVTK